MPEPKQKKKRLRRAESNLRHTNRVKAVRVFLQFAVLAVVLWMIVSSVIQSNIERAAETSELSTQTSDATGAMVTRKADEASSFIAISYPGLTTSTSLDSKIVNQKVFQEQIAALKASGYETITQDDIANFYLRYSSLPKKALFIIFEDGLSGTTYLAQDTLKENDYLATACSYAGNLNSLGDMYLTAATLKTLPDAGCWEIGSNGYRLSYINVFDRYENFFGELNAREFLDVHEYLWREYNHYLMDFIRDEDHLRMESEAELVARIDNDYKMLHSDYIDSLGFVPGLYILMHSNTGAFGTDVVASDANRDNIMSLFTMNFNREGTCLNNRDSSIYDLSRLQVQSYFSTNHMLMRIWDDTGDTLQFVTGDQKEAAHWYLDDGAVEFKNNDQIILTSEPVGKSTLTLNSRLFSDLDMTVTLTGNLVGRQSIYLRTDRNLEHGIEVALVDNNLEVYELGGDGEPLFTQDLFVFDGGPFISTQEDEHNGLVALQKAIIKYDDDSKRIAQATAKLRKLENTPVLTLEDGGTPYYPVNDTATRGNRKLRIRLVGKSISLWIDDKPVVNQLEVPYTQTGSLALGAAVFENIEGHYTQHNVYDDVYDAVFNNLTVNDAQDVNSVLYAYTLSAEENVGTIISEWFHNLADYMAKTF
ncbi:MAG: hypothetical protein PHY64_05940 [Eubacteriales bacterium]|nr:hypothetical protein [Eubacteriales bacterium]